MLVKRLQGQKEKQNGCYYEFDLHSTPLGEGGMGIVYKGFRISEVTGSRSVVAIKAMYDGLPEEVYERARREASITLHNDNLVEMLGFVEEIEVDQVGAHRRRYYVISEYLNGVVLSDLLSGKFKDRDGIEIPYAKQLYLAYISDREATSVNIIRCILSGVLALHYNGYIHRDIDPTNIMVTDRGLIKLIDFGIAKSVSSLGSVDKLLTSTGKFIGKAEFASPELVLGDVASQGYWTDIYAIGILLYLLLVGRLPFTGSKYEVLQAQLNNKVPVKHIKNPSLAKVVKKATEKNKSDRYSSVAEMMVEIDKSMSARPNPMVRYWKIGVIAAMACVACAVVIPSLINRTKEPRKIVAVAQHIDKNSDDKLHETFQHALAKLDSDNAEEAVKGLSLMKNLAEDNCVEAIRELGITYCPYGNVQSPVVKKRREILRLTDSTANISLDYLEKAANSNSPLSADALYVLGYSYWKKGEWEKGAQALQKGLDLLPAHDTTYYNGLSSTDLKKNLDRYLRLCQKEMGKK